MDLYLFFSQLYLFSKNWLLFSLGYTLQHFTIIGISINDVFKKTITNNVATFCILLITITDRPTGPKIDTGIDIS